jgi:archaellum biogenesis ATPase FlaH
MQLNEGGEEWLSRQIATQISKHVTNTREEIVIILTWNDGPTYKQITVDIHSKSEISLNQNNESQGNETEKEAIVHKHQIERKKYQSLEIMICYGNSDIR